MRKSKDKRKESPYIDKRLRVIYFIPLILAIAVVLIPSLLGEWRINYLLSDRFIYPVAYFLNNTQVQLFLFAILFVIGLIILIDKIRVIFIIMVFVISPVICVGSLILSLNTSGIWARETSKTVSFGQDTYYLSHIVVLKLPMQADTIEKYHRIVYKCDDYRLVCETKSSYTDWLESAWNVHLNGSFDLIIHNNQLLFVYRFHENFIPRYGEFETIAIIEDNLDE